MAVAGRRTALRVHTGLVLVPAVGAVLAFATANPDDGACIGCGLLLLPLLAMGLPWSVLPFAFDLWPRTSNVGALLVGLVPAVVNLGLHYVFLRLREEKARARGG